MRALVVVDEKRLRAFLTGALAAEGFGVNAAFSGRECVAHVLSDGSDLVVLDLALADLNGLDVLADLHAQRPDVPVLILSDDAGLQMKLRAFELGAIDYLVKPFALEELLARARVHLRRVHGRREPARLRLGPLTLDVARREAHVGSLIVELPDREFRVLYFLMLHEGEVISRQRLLAEVWGYTFDPRSNVVDVCVRRLRRQLGAAAPIKTVRNVGYRAAA